MKALVLAGGEGSRLRPFSYSMPKQLIPVANKPVLVHVLENVRATGVRDIGVVVGGRGDEVRAVLGDGSRFGVDLTYIPQHAPRGLAHAVMVARDFLQDDDFVMYLGDNMLPAGIAGHAERFTAQRPAAEVLVTKVADPRSYGVVELGRDAEVLRLVEKPAHPRSDLAIIGVYFFTPAIHEAVDAIRPSARGELEITDAVQWLTASGARVQATRYEGYWKDTGTIEDVLECNGHVLDHVRPSVAGDLDSTWLSGAVVVEKGASVTRSVIKGPVIIGAGSRVQDSWIGPHTSIGRGCILQGAHMERSIVLDGATITRISGLYGSLIGRAASVSSVECEGRHRLLIGDHTRVEMPV